jgi:chitinase
MQMIKKAKKSHIFFSFLGVIILVGAIIYLGKGIFFAHAAGSIIPDHYFAPYVDAGGDLQTQTGATDLADLAQKSGDKYFTLGFIDSGNGCTPEWEGSSISLTNDNGTLGQTSVVSSNAVNEINALRQAGGDVIISFGGEDGTELASACSSVQSLEQAYQSVVDHYKVDHIDFDIEGSTSLNHATDDLRSQALASLQQKEQQAGTTVYISLTLPSEPMGLVTSPNSDGLYVAQSAINNGVNVNKFNLMTMYYQGYCNSPCDMGQAATQSADALAGQLQQWYGQKGQNLSSDQIEDKIGITPFVESGQPDNVATTPAQAQTIFSYAQQHNIGMLSEWSTWYDSQQNYAFSKIFVGFDGTSTGSNPGSTTPIVEPTTNPIPTTTLSPSDTPTIASTPTTTPSSTPTAGIPAWTSDGHPLYSPGQQVTYQGQTYVCLRQIWGQVGWEPTAPGILNNFWAPATSANPTPSSSGIPAWTSDGSTLYTPGQQVTYQGQTYVCLRQIRGQVGWEPTAPGILNNFWALANSGTPTPTS